MTQPAIDIEKFPFLDDQIDEYYKLKFDLGVWDVRDTQIKVRYIHEGRYLKIQGGILLDRTERLSGEPTSADTKRHQIATR